LRTKKTGLPKGRPAEKTLENLTAGYIHGNGTGVGDANFATDIANGISTAEIVLARQN